MGKEYIREVLVLGDIPRMGPVILFDDIEDLKKWDKAGTGADYDVTKDTAKAFNGDASLKLVTRVTSPADGDNVTASRKLYQSTSKELSAELFFNYSEDSKVDNFTLEFWWNDGAAMHIAKLKYDTVNNKWQYWNSGGTYTDVPGGSQTLAENAWHRVKVKINRGKTEYVSLVCNTLEISLADIAYQSGASGNAEALQLKIRLENNGANQAVMYVDDVLCRAE